jgi:hypothetical protein
MSRTTQGPGKRRIDESDPSPPDLSGGSSGKRRAVDSTGVKLAPLVKAANAHAQHPESASASESSPSTLVLEPVSISIFSDGERFDGLDAIEEVERLAKLADEELPSTLRAKYSEGRDDEVGEKLFDLTYIPNALKKRSHFRRTKELECFLGLVAHTNRAKPQLSSYQTPTDNSIQINSAKEKLQELYDTQHKVKESGENAEKRLRKLLNETMVINPETPTALLEEYYHRCICAEGTLGYWHRRWKAAEAVLEDKRARIIGRAKLTASEINEQKNCKRSFNKYLAEYKAKLGPSSDLYQAFKEAGDAQRELPEMSQNLQALLLMGETEAPKQSSEMAESLSAFLTK